MGIFNHLIIACSILSLVSNDYDSARYDSLFVDRGAKGANMTTDALALVVKNNVVYQMKACGLAETRSSLYATDLETLASNPDKIEVPAFLEVEADWDQTPQESGAGNNILGDNGILTLPFESLNVPSIEATNETLAYYGAMLIKKGDVVKFPDEGYPLFRMTVGERYVDEFVMGEGGGFYLEFHNDKPHFHMPLQGGGNYILARWNEEGTKLQITGFKIPDGYAVYTKKGAIHCDAALTGDLLVGYDQAEEASTVLLRDPSKKMTKINFYTP